jgi:predicted nucleotidyltransferase
MYKKVNITENHLRILTLFTKNREYFVREVNRLTKLSPRTAQLILEDLEKKAVLEANTRGKIKLYKLKETFEAKLYLTLTENYKKITFFKTNPLIKEIIEKILPFIKGTALIFGSYAKGTNKQDSDLDLFIAGKCEEEKIDKISDVYGINISLKIYGRNAFKQPDTLTKEVIDNHVLVKGELYD